MERDTLEAKRLVETSDAPPGERLGLTGWMRALGWQNRGEPPRRRWWRQNVHVVSDESELSAFMPGPRGTTGGVQGGGAVIATYQVRGGNAGCRVRFAVGDVTGTGGLLIAYAVLAPVTLTAAVNLTVTWSDPDRLGETTAQRGTLAAVPLPLVNNGVFSVGAGHAYQPLEELWVPPGRAALLWNTAVGGTLAVMIHLKEPGSAPA